ncbi:MAG: hypothetical protein IJZ30_03250 [Alphaproteobacteria bacterium]|nr:hypothetical protein [Alphaproteobacteria bacterium]
MEKEKISVEEISLLEKRAKKERLLHQKIMLSIDRGCVLYDEKEMLHSADEKTMLEIVERSRKDEIKALLERYKNGSEPHWLRLPSSVQMKLYQWLTGGKTGVTEPGLLTLMLENCRLCEELEKELIDVSFSLNQCQLRQKLNYFENEVYFIQKTLEFADTIDRIEAFNCIEQYLNKYHLSRTTSEVCLIEKFLSLTHGRDSVIDKAESIVKKYISYVKDYNAPNTWQGLSQLALIKSGNHNLIMHFLRTIPNIDNFKAVKELQERANREEIEFYYQRYSEA